MKQTFILCAVLLLCHSLGAHEIYTSYSSIEVKETHLTYTLTLDETELKNIFDLDINRDGTVTENELTTKLEEIYKHFEKKVAIIIAGDPVALARGKAYISGDSLGNVFVNLVFKQTLERQPWKLTLHLNIFNDFGPRHKNLVKIVHQDEVQQSILTIDSRTQEFSFSGKGVSFFKHGFQFFNLGFEHIVIGYDHIFFLLGLILIGGSFLNLVKIVSSFTVAHSITLILAALQVVAIPSRLVESVIALSIVYIALENFFIKKTDERWLITFIFGLMHGFGFAGVLHELGLPTEGLAVSLLSFNLGVEVGQIIIVAVTFPIIYLITKTKWQKQIVFGLSSVIMVFGLMWFLERAFDLDLPIV